MIEMVFDKDALVTEWVQKQLPEGDNFSTETVAIGVAKDGELIGGAVYSGYRRSPHGGSVEMSIAGRPGWLTKRSIRVLLYYPFQDLGCARITCMVKRSNKRSRKLAERLGFSLEGCARRVFSNVKAGDCMIYGLLKTENRWFHG